MPSKDTEIISFEVPNAFRKRARNIKRLFKVSLAQMCRDGLTDQLEFYEGKARLQKEQEKKSSTTEPRHSRTLKRAASLGPTPLERGAAVEDDRVDPFDAIYVRHAKRIVPVLDDKIERRLRVADAVREVKQFAPLTCPADEDIVAELQKRVVALLRSDDNGDDVVPTKPLRRVKLESTAQSATTFELLEKRLMHHIGIDVETTDEAVGREIDVSKVRTSGSVDLETSDEDKEPSNA